MKDAVYYERYMNEALKEAKKAYEKKEVPIGAVVVKKGEIIGRGYNLKECCQDTTEHAEIIAIKEACKNLGHWRLEGCTLYTTLEPCPMCMGAIINSRMKRVVYGSRDFKSGVCDSVMRMHEFRFNHKVLVNGGILAEESKALLTKFFGELRNEKKKE